MDAKKSDAVCVCVCVCVCVRARACVCAIRKETFTTSCCRSVKRLILTFTINNWKDYAKQSKESDQNSIGKALSFITITTDIFGDPKKIERTWLRSFDASTS